MEKQRKSQTPHKLKYVEEKPIKQEIIFENKHDYWKFFDNRYNEILEMCFDPTLKAYNFQKAKEIYVYQTILLKKDGSPCRHHLPIIRTEKWKESQKIGWEKYRQKLKEKREGDKFEISGGNRLVLETIPRMMEDNEFRQKLRGLTIEFKQKKAQERGFY